LPSTLIFDADGPRTPEFQPGQIFHISSPLTEFVFEWHPETKRVYMARVGTKPMIGELIADNITGRGDAVNAVLIWHRGYRTREYETVAAKDPVPGLDRFE
jgi:hypothetical protein